MTLGTGGLCLAVLVCAAAGCVAAAVAVLDWGTRCWWAVRPGPCCGAVYERCAHKGTCLKLLTSMHDSGPAWHSNPAGCSCQTQTPGGKPGMEHASARMQRWRSLVRTRRCRCRGSVGSHFRIPGRPLVYGLLLPGWPVMPAADYAAAVPAAGRRANESGVTALLEHAAC